MAAGPTVDEILQAVSESGYLMEQEVATQLEQRGLHVRTNVAFEDSDEGKSREIDVVATKRVALDEPAKLAAFVEVIAECKNSSNPFVFIARPKNSEDTREAPQEFMFPYQYNKTKLTDKGSMSREVSAFHHLGFDEVFVERKNAWKAVQFCRIDRRGSGWHANHGGLYDAIFYPIAKAVVSRKSKVPTGSRAGEWRYFWFFFPIVVTSGELFLIDSTAETPSPRLVDQISFKRELRSGKLSGSFMLTFVRQPSLEAFLEAVVDPIASLAADLITNRRALLTDTELPWSD